MNSRQCKSEVFIRNQENTSNGLQASSDFNPQKGVTNPESDDVAEDDESISDQDMNGTQVIVCDETDSEMETDENGQEEEEENDKDAIVDYFHSVELVSMNKNSNGNTSNWKSAAQQSGDSCIGKVVDKALHAPPKKLKRKNVETSNKVTTTKATLKKIKAMCMGEIPLRPVGLSLSGSGMELYVNVDPRKRKVLNGSDKKAKCAKAKIVPRQSKGKQKFTMTQPQSIAAPIFKLSQDDVEVFSSHPSFRTPLVLCPQRIPTKSTSSSHDAQATETDRGDMDSDVMILDIKKEVDDGSYNDTNLKVSDSGWGFVGECSHQTACVSNGRSYKINETAHDRLQCSHGYKPKSLKEQVKRDDYVFKVPARVSNNGNHSMAFTSADLPLKPFYSQKDFGPSNASKANFNNHRYANNNGLDKKCSRWSDLIQNGSSKDPIPVTQSSIHESERPGGSKDFVLIGDSTYVLNRDRLEEGNDHRKKLIAENNNADVSPTSVSMAEFDIPVSGMDEATVAKFIKYTTSMRKDLKSNCRKLSNLIKEFNSEVVEHYKTSDSNRNTSTDLSETDDVNNRTKCSIM